MRELKFSEILRRNQELFLLTTGKEYRIKILNNITTNSLVGLLEYVMLDHAIRPSITVGNYDNIVQDSTVCNEQDMVIVFYDSFRFTVGLPAFFEGIDESLYEQLYTRICQEIDMTLENLKDCPSVVFNSFSSSCFASAFTQHSLLDKLVSELNRYISGKNQRNLTILDLDKVISEVSVSKAVDMRFFYSSKAPYTLDFLKQYALAVLPEILKNCGKLKKALIFDCDNTLWSGILGEDGTEGIEMSPATHTGEIFHTVQQIAAWLSKQGVIIGICSKNNAEDVAPVFDDEKGIAFLRNKDIVISKVNWNDKVSNLREIARELNIGIDSLVFVDDSPFEINMVREQLPDVLTIQVPKSLYTYPGLLLEHTYRYFNLIPNQEDQNKTELYKNQAKRNAAKNSAMNLEQYLASLHIVLTIKRDDTTQVERIAQLSQKTNQFNLTTKRYTESQIEHLMSDENSEVISVSVQDDFGDNGMTGLAVIRIEGNDAEIDTLLMSCRIIGRNIEYVIIDAIIAALNNRKIKEIRAYYMPTAKNAQVENLFERVGFEVQSNVDGNKTYRLDISGYKPSGIDYIKINS